jgi:hypothetical protein
MRKRKEIKKLREEEIKLNEKREREKKRGQEV